MYDMLHRMIFTADAVSLSRSMGRVILEDPDKSA